RAGARGGDCGEPDAMDIAGRAGAGAGGGAPGVPRGARARGGEPVPRQVLRGGRRPAVDTTEPTIRVRRIHRRDLNRVWEFLKRVFRSVNRETVEYQRPRTKTRFIEIYEEEGIEQLVFEVHEGEAPVIVGYAECAYEVIGSDNWINERYFETRDMRPLF